MNWIWFLPVILVVVLAGVFYPVFSRRGGGPLPIGLEGDPGVELAAERDALLVQIKDLETTADGDEESMAARAAMERELAAVLTRLDQLAAAPHTREMVIVPRNPLQISIALSLMLLIGVLTAGSYLVLGTTEKIEPAAQAEAFPPEFVAMVEQSARKLRDTPDDLQGWLRLARSYVVLSRPAEAMAAYAMILSRHPGTMDAVVGLAELEVQSDDPRVQEEGVKRFQGVLASAPDRPEALWVLGGVAMRSGDRATALAHWKRLQPLLQSGTSARRTVDQAIREAERSK
ncbi:MAG: tetratricopeptide repeat protein [Magnetococcales bacterium]|nr:tetratricopeptide repeat protein [Magnetococcales bacterium]